MANNTPANEPKTKRILLKKGGRLWFSLKSVECVLVLVCLLLLIITQFLYVIVDDFTPLKNETANHSVNCSNSPISETTIEPPKTTVEPPKKDSQPKTRQEDDFPKVIIVSKESTQNRSRRYKNEHLESELMSWDAHISINETLKRVKKDDEEETVTPAPENSTECTVDSISLNDLLIMFPCSTTLFMIIAMEVLGELFKDPLSKLSTLILIFLCIILSITLFIVSLLAYIEITKVTLILITVTSGLLAAVEIANFVLVILS